MPSLNRQILIAACLGVLIGWAIGLLPADQGARSGVLYVSTLVGSIFIGMLKMVPVWPICRRTIRSIGCG